MLTEDFKTMSFLDEDDKFLKSTRNSVKVINKNESGNILLK